MLKVLSPDQMQRADEAAIRSGVVSFDLMKAAGFAVARAASEMMGGSYGRRVTVLCGKGNNGGDGLVAARYLARSGVAVKALLSDDTAGLKGDARTAFESFLESCGPAALAPLGPAVLRGEMERSDLIIDALLGTGFRGALRGPPAEAVEMVNRNAVRVISVDIPSGVDGSSGRIEGAAIRARKTVTLAALKPGLLLHPGATHAGEVEIAEIGIADEHMGASMHLAEGSDVAAVLPPRPPNAHKRSVGKVLIVAGSSGMSGAAILAATAALRTGAGLVWVAAPRSAASIIEAAATEVVVRALPETSSGAIAAAAVEAVLDLAERADSVALGPGITRQPETMQLVREVANVVQKPLILDADGINTYEGRAEDLKARRTSTVLTPHAGELARLLGEDAKHIESDPLESARRAAEVTGAAVLLKGNPTLIAGPGGVVAVNTGGPFLATAGTGDVLTGVISALAAQAAPFNAAWAGAWLQGTAGRLSLAETDRLPAGQRADRGLIASDLLETLPAAILYAGSLGV